MQILSMMGPIEQFKDIHWSRFEVLQGISIVISSVSKMIKYYAKILFLLQCFSTGVAQQIGVQREDPNTCHGNFLSSSIKIL